MATRHRHPVNRAMIDDAPFGARVADRVTGFMGSWRFIIVQTVIVALWLAGNLYLLTRAFDPYPFILLNLAFSTQAAYAAPLILLAGNRAAAHDRMTLEHAASEADVEEEQNERLLKGNTDILEHVAALEQRILDLESRILGALGSAPMNGQGGAAGRGHLTAVRPSGADEKGAGVAGSETKVAADAAAIRDEHAP